jgi:hypothetical protein
LIEDATPTDDESVIGEEAHIVAREEDGPRGQSILSREQRDAYSNLILLCRKHHKIVDDQLNEYTVEKLHKLKIDHLRWIEENLSEYKEKIKVTKQEELIIAVKSAQIILELENIKEAYYKANWKKRPDVIEKLNGYVDHSNIYVSTAIIELLNRVA